MGIIGELTQKLAITIPSLEGGGMPKGLRSLDQRGIWWAGLLEGTTIKDMQLLPEKPLKAEGREGEVHLGFSLYPLLSNICKYFP